MSCFPCCALYRWIRGHDDRGNPPERQPLFPPPSTILTPPQRRPNLPNLSSSSLEHVTNASGGAIWSSAPVSPAKSTGGFRADQERAGSSSRLNEEGRERMGSISRAYGGRMQFLQPNVSTPSTPSIPSTPVGPGPGHLRPLSSLRPLTATSSSTPTGHHNASSRDSQADRECERERGQVPLPYRPSVPNMGRSASEPRNLADLGGFAPHQVPFGALTVGRGRACGSALGRVTRGRNRSATVTASQRFSSLSVDVSSEGKGRGRSPGPALMSSAMIIDGSGSASASASGFGSANVEQEAAGDATEDGTQQGSSAIGRSMSYPTLYSGTNNDEGQGPPQSQARRAASEISIGHTHSRAGSENEDEEEGEDLSGSIVVKRELGLRGLGALSARARARGGKRRTDSRGSGSGSGSGTGSGSGRRRLGGLGSRPADKGGKRILTE
ncbi:hypothetical protein I316_02192 [Kwoniella heveanensis BCC8398]|uniref:Uncharacterized protein n=1 Tax=Kwoniella heveanensis BCC8398 TaxID=1296120 RepID=A0A1B9GZ75_9TREE|nr:hypothetical protein I316_02192 [Kwoniella heveanensis BCC8398]